MSPIQALMAFVNGEAATDYKLRSLVMILKLAESHRDGETERTLFPTRKFNKRKDSVDRKIRSVVRSQIREKEGAMVVLRVGIGQTEKGGMYI